MLLLTVSQRPLFTYTESQCTRGLSHQCLLVDIGQNPKEKIQVCISFFSKFKSCGSKYYEFNLQMSDVISTQHGDQIM